MKLLNCFMLAFVAACLTMTVGCSPQTHPLTGEVTFEGKPLDQGSISLVPDGTKGTVGAGSVAVINNGKFTIPAKVGVLTGHYNVTVISEQSAADESGDPSMRSIVSLFPPYKFSHEFTGDKSTLHMTIEVPSEED